ncbi:DUF2493 domain-containing protein [Pseudactinotalea sp. Z1748]|uniref:DUF2493 domain-containing protein n=1 Tax=Pseudactinotalea sp. Z1748 TaxID=3413027 RepID=UPI003C7BFCFD
MRILVTGSRTWTDAQVVEQALDEVLATAEGAEVVLVHGACPTGADYFADLHVRRLGLPVEAHPADWRAHGRAAGPIRNAQMVDLGADIVLSFPLGTSRGTWHTTRLAKRAGIPVRIIAGKSNVEVPT